MMPAVAAAARLSHCKNKGGQSRPICLHALSYQLPIWCAVGDKLVGSTYTYTFVFAVHYNPPGHSFGVNNSTSTLWS